MREEFLRLSQEAGHVGSWDWNLLTGEVRWSPEMYRLHGRDPATFPLNLESALACYHSEDRLRIDAAIPRVIKSGRLEPGDVRVLLPNGEMRSHWVKGRVECDASGRAVRMLGVNVDVTERRAAAAALERENRFRHAVIENAGNGICVCHEIPDPPGWRFSVWNSQMSEITGYTVDDINARGWFETVYPDPATRQRARQRVERIRAGDELRNEEWEITRSDGARRQVLITTCRLMLPDEQPGVLAVMHDITAAKRAEQELAARARQQGAVAQLGLEAFVAADADALLREVVPVLCEILDVEFVSVLVACPQGETMLLRAGAGWRPGVIGTAIIDASSGTLAGHTLLAGEPVTCADLRGGKRFEPPALWLEHGIASSATAAISGRDRPWGVLGVHSARVRKFSRDETGFLRAVADLLAQAVERDHTAQALRASEERYRTVVDDARDAIFGLAADRTVLWANRAAETLTGWSRADWVGRSFALLVHPEDASRTVELLRGLLLGERPAPFEIRLRTKSGGFVPLEFAVTAQNIDGRVVTIMGIGRDVTARLRLEAQLRQSQKMQSIGQLAGGVAHDFNNVLQAITGFATIALRPGLSDAERNELLEEVLAATMRGGDISRQLLTFSRQHPPRGPM